MSNINDFVIKNGVLIKYTEDRTKIVVPSSVNSIGDAAFVQGYEISLLPFGVSEGEIEDIFIPKTVTSIGEGAFFQGPWFTLYYEGTEDEWNRVSIKSREEWFDPDGEINIEFNCGTTDEINATSNVIYSTLGISDYGENIAQVIKNMSKNSDVTIASSFKGNPVAIIYYNAFGGDSNLESVTLPSSVKVIRYGAFSWCSNLSSITIPSSVTEIGDDVFDGCGNLVIKGEAGSYAEKYAIENDIPFEAIEI